MTEPSQPADDVAHIGRAVRRFATAVALVSIIGIAVAGMALFIAARELPAHRLATYLVLHGVEARIDAVGAASGTTAEVTFDADGRTVTARVATTESSYPEVGWQVVYDPADPTRALLADDLSYFAEVSLEGGLGVAALAAMPAVLTTAVWLIRRRPPWWRLVDKRWIAMP